MEFSQLNLSLAFVWQCGRVGCTSHTYGGPSMLTKFRAFLRDESGATAIEYGLIAALIAVAIIAAVGFVGEELENTFNAVGNALQN